MFYSGYQLSFSSDLICPELAPGQGPSDVNVRFGDVPSTLENATHDSVPWWCVPGKCLFKAPAIARYLISGGREIVIAPEVDAEPESIRLSLLGPVLGALLHQRNLLPLHASAIATSRGAVLFTGTSGSGKSTLAAAFLRRGYSVLADDVCAIDASDTPAVLPGNPYLMLWEDSIRQLGFDSLHFKPVRRDFRKFIVPLGDAFSREPAPIRAIYVIGDENATDFSLSPLRGFRKMETLSLNTYRRSLVGSLELMTQHSSQVNRVAAAAPMSRVSRPQFPFPLDAMVDLLVEDFERR